jgi:hypothetical protein
MQMFRLPDALRQALVTANNAINSDSKKRRGFRYAPATTLLAAGYGWR